MMKKGIFALAAAMAVQAWFASPSFAQAWISPSGEITLALTFQYNEFLGHLDDRGNKFPGDLESYSRLASVDLDYSLSDRLALTIGIPFVWTRNGDDHSPVAGRTGVDDGQWHGTLQDWRLSARYQLLVDPIILTPFIQYQFSSHQYETRAEAAPGRDLDELTVGFYAGRVLESIPNTYIHSRIGYTFVEKLAQVSTDRLSGDLSFGYFITPYITMSISGTFHNTYGGLTVDYLFNPEDFSINPGVTEEEFLEHDRILHDDQIRAGFGVSYTLNAAWSAYAGYATVVDGASSHYGDGITVGLQWNRNMPHLWQSPSSEK